MSPEARAHTCPRPGRGPFINDVRIDPLSRGEFVRRIEGFLACGRSHIIHFIPADPTVRAMDDPAYREVLNSGDLNVADGMAVAWASRLLGHKTERLPGADAMALLGRWGMDSDIRHYLFGSTPHVLQGLERRMELWFPGIRIVGVQSPPFRPQDDHELSEASTQIRDARTDLLWVGLGTPKQDQVAERLRRLDTAPVLLCVGAAFDFLSGSRRRAPEWMQQAGLEWVHRLVEEPTRLWQRYLLGNPRFVLGIIRGALAKRRSRL